MGFSPIGLQCGSDLVSNLLWREYLRVTWQSQIALCRGLEKKELEQWAHVCASRKPVLVVSHIYPSKPLSYQACHPAWETKGQTTVEGDAGDMGMATAIKSEHLQTFFGFSWKFSISPLLASEEVISWLPLWLLP